MEELNPIKKCQNCGHDLPGEYCGNCGQKAIQGAITIKMVFADFIQFVFLFDSSLYKTLRGLLLKPGVLVKTYLSGKRKRYLPPFQFFLLFMTIHLIVLNYFGDGLIEDLNNEIQIEEDKLTEVELIQSIVRKNLNILYFILTPIIAVFVHLFYRKVKFNLAETLIFSLYVMGAGFFLSSIIALLSQIDSKIYMAKALIILGYFPYAIMQFTDSFSIIGAIKSLGTILLSYFIYIVLLLIVVSLYAYLFIL